MEFSALQIATILNGTVEGDEDATVNNLSKIEEGLPKTLSFLANPKYNHYIYETNATIVIVNNSLRLEKPIKPTLTLIRVENAYEAFAKLLELYDQFRGTKVGIEQPSYLAPDVKYGEGCYIGAFAYLSKNVRMGNHVKIHPQVFIGDNCKIGDNTVIYPGVKIYHNCIIGSNVTIHSGTIVGSDGFGFAPTTSENEFKKVPHIGNVVIEDNVEIGSNVSIDRATIGSTIIRKGAKLDNLIQIAHNVEIGENTVIAGQTGVAGSAKVGKNCMIAAQVGIVGHIKIADGVKIAGQSGIGATVEEEGVIMQGSPAFKASEYKRSLVIFRNLPKLHDRLREIELKLK
jgi:UDP-3-O-[3-hydroxymyristoyl] glucosamine N-acyltransferase